MRPCFTPPSLFAAAGLSMACLALPAAAAEELMVLSDETQTIQLEQAPHTVVVGNPSIADVTLDGRLLLLHGRGFGRTNVILFDAEGRQLREFKVNVATEDPYGVAIFRAGKRQTLSCKGDCQPTLQVGDAPEAAAATAAAQTLRLDAVRANLPQQSASDPLSPMR